MKFRLYYEGKLASTRGKPEPGQIDSRASHKHEIRKRFHSQLKHLWKTNPILKSWTDSGRAIEATARQFTCNNFKWAPLVTEEIKITCALDILYLRNGFPYVMDGGDIDNRVKTLVDALKIPKQGELPPDAIPGVTKIRSSFCFKTTLWLPVYLLRQTSC